MVVLPPRPGSSPGLLASTRSNAAAWMRWFGVGRIALVVAGSLITIIGGLWLTLTPDPSAASEQAAMERAQSYIAVTPTEFTLQPSMGPVTTHSADRAADLSEPMVFVHVVGAVALPGVYSLPATSRVIDAIAAAGGATSEAQVDAMNLAGLLSDGQRLVVPTVAEVRDGSYQLPVAGPPASSPGGTGSRPAATGSANEVDRRIDLNSAGAEELTELPGIGPVTAAAIVEDRIARGPFLRVEDLLRVRGIGPAKLEALRHRARV
jgi:competence protein ComEA